MSIHLIEIRNAEYKKSKAGNPMFEVSLHDRNTGEYLARDWLTMSREALKYTDPKLKALGCTSRPAENQASMLNGKSAVVTMYEEQWKGRTQLKVDSEAGYRAASTWNDSANSVADLSSELFNAQSIDDVPF